MENRVGRSRLRPTRTATAAAVIASVLGVVLALSWLVGNRLFDSLNMVGDTLFATVDEMTSADGVLDALRDGEGELRGYLLTGQEAYLERYRATGPRAEHALAALDGHARETPWLVPLARELRAAADARRAELDLNIAQAVQDDREAARRAVRSDDGQASMLAVRQLAARIIQAAEMERERELRRLVSQERVAIAAVLAAIATGATLLGLAALRLLVSRDRLTRAQDALRGLSQRLQGTVDHVRDGVAVFDPTDRLILWNRNFFTRAGIPDSLARAGTPFGDFAAAAAGWEPALLDTKRPAAVATAMEVRRNGAVMEVWRSTLPDGGQVLAVADITDRVAVEAIARQAQKLQALGQLTGGVAHDFNNLLQIVSANLELLEKRMGAQHWLRTYIDGARIGIARGTQLTRHLLAFARRQPLAPEIFDPATLLARQMELLRRTLGGSISIRLEVEPGIWPVRADPHQLENAVLNLALNARDAMPRGGDLMLAARNADALPPGDRNAEAGDAAAEFGEFVMIEVRDTGKGMSEEQLARAVEPFYTTKPEGSGSGLGLSMVYGFARQSGGAFRLESRQGEGTTARIYLPRAQAEAAPRADASEAVGG